MNVDFRCEHCGQLLCAPSQGSEPVRCPHCQKLAAIPAGLASLPRPKVAADEAAPPPLPASPPAPGAEASETREAALWGGMAGALETVMPFVISLFFHIGVVLVTVFVATSVNKAKEPPKEIVVPSMNGTGIPGEDDREAGGTLTPSEVRSDKSAGGGSRFASKQTESSVRNSIIASAGGNGEARKGMAMIGVGSATGGTGESGTGVGKGTGWFSGAGGGGGKLFGMGDGDGGGRRQARHFVYVIDCSGSMLYTFGAVKDEMMRSIGLLDYEKRKQDFHVILFAEGKPKEAEDKRLVPATDEYKQRVAEWINKQNTEPGTEVLPALARAFDVLDKVDSPGGKVIFLLTDSDFKGDEEKAIALCKARNTKKDVCIYTYLYGDKPDLAVKTMEKIAADSGGRYKFVSGEEE
jgi:hypothetical protein